MLSLERGLAVKPQSLAYEFVLKRIRFYEGDPIPPQTFASSTCIGLLISRNAFVTKLFVYLTQREAQDSFYHT
jgi:hypothetical protein